MDKKKLDNASCLRMCRNIFMYAWRAFELISVEDYLEGEKKASCKHEFIHGKVYAMAGASEAHNRIAGNVFAQILFLA